MLPVHDAFAQPAFGLGTWGGDVEVGYEWERQQTKTGDPPESELHRRRYDERLGIRNQGFHILDPRLFTGSLGLTFDLFQERDRIDGAESSHNGKLTGYAFDAGILSEKPYSAMLFANRNENTISREFAGRSQIAYENRGATLRLREDSLLRDLGVPYFNATLGARQERTQESATVLNQTFERDEQRNVVSFEANKGFETADLGLRYEFTDLEDRVRPQGSFQTQTAGVTYSLDFGPTLSRRWDSRVHYFERRDGSPFSFFSVDEKLRIDHYENLFTDYRYLLSRIVTEAGAMATHNEIFQAQHRLYRNLTTDLRAEGMQQELPNGERTNYAGQLDLNYQRALPRNGRAFVRLGTRYQLDDNDLAVSQVEVVGEPHTAPAPLGAGAGFLLNNPFVVTSSIVVVDTRSGRVTAVLGVDYDVVQEGDYPKIVPLVTSLVIQAGDTLEVSYAFELAPSMRFSTVSYWAGAGMDLQWIAFSFYHDRHDQTLLAGRDGQFLDDRSQNTFQVELRGDWKQLQARASAAYQAQDSTRLAYNRWQYGQSLSYRPRYNLTLGLQAEESFTEYTSPQRESETRSVRATLDRFAADGWYWTAFAGVRVLEDSLMPTETLREAGVKPRRYIGKLEIAPSLTWYDRRRGAIETSDLRLDLRLRRRF